MKYRIVIGIGISVFLLAFFLLTTDFGRMVDALAGANYWFVLPAAGMYLVSVYFRAMRWTVMLRHLKPVRTTRLYPVVTIGYMANNILPMRLGELVRSYYVGEREGISKAAALATVLAERVFDALTLLLMIAAVAPFVSVGGMLEALGERYGVPRWALVVGFSAPFVGAFGAMALAALYPERARSLAMTLARPLPDRVATLADSLISRALEGLAPMREPRKLGILFALSVPIWLTEAAVFWIMGFPFGVAEAHAGAMEMVITMILVTSITNIGASVPAAPGGIGLFEIIARETLVLSPLSSVDRATAAGFALVVHIVVLLPMIALGQVFLWTAQVSLRRLSEEGRKPDD